MSTLHPVEKAAKHVGSQSELAALLGVTKGAVPQWRTPGRGVPIEHCAAIERLTGGAVTRRDLRPADWWRIWPELVSAEHPAPRAVDRAAA